MNNVRQLFDSGWYTVKYCNLQSDPKTDQIHLDGCVQERSSHVLVDASLVVLTTVCYPALFVIVTLGEMALLLDLAVQSVQVKKMNKRIAELATEDVSQALQARVAYLSKQCIQYQKQISDIKLEYKIGIHTLPTVDAIKLYYDEKKDSKKWSERLAAHQYLVTLRAYDKALLEFSKLNEVGDREERYRGMKIAELEMSLVKSEIRWQVHLHHIQSIALMLIPLVGSVIWLHLGKTVHDELQPSLIDQYNGKIGQREWLPRF